jgi:hypothetical protein
MIPTMTEDVVRDHQRRLLDEALHRSLVRQGKEATASATRSMTPDWSVRHALAGRLRRLADRLERRPARPTIWV